jgi:hypothetical protein
MEDNTKPEEAKRERATIDHLPATEVWRLLDHLITFAPPDSTDEQKQQFINDRLPNFFEGMSLLQMLQFESICKTRDERLYKDFVRDYPNIVVNLKGTGPEMKPTGWEIKSLALDLKVQQAEENRRTGKMKNQDKQILRYKTLDCLLSMHGNMPYEIAKTNFRLKHKNETDVTPVLDGIMSEYDLLKKYFDLKIFVSLMLQYMTKNSVQSYGLFSLCVFQRLDCIIKDIK